MKKDRNEAFDQWNRYRKNNKIVFFEDIEEIRDILSMGRPNYNEWQEVSDTQKLLKSQSYYWDMLDRLAHQGPVEPADVNTKQFDFNQLDHFERFVLYSNWVNRFLKNTEEEAIRMSDEYNKNAEILHELRMEQDKSILQDAYIVAMTTTGSSRYHSVLKEIGPRIVIVEEAAEVFESHIVASLSKHCEHLILIGDHIQLRPNPTVYELAKDYHLDVSLFERLLKNDTKKV